VLYVKTYSQNEALDLTVYCHAGRFALQHFIAPFIYRELGKLAGAVHQGQTPDVAPACVRRVRSQGIL